jgi:hypothetical protein
MKIIFRLLPRLIFFTTLVFSTAISAQSFTLKTVQLTHPANGSVMHMGSSLAVSGHSSNARWLSLVDTQEFKALAVDIPADAQFFTKMKLANITGEQLVFLTTQGISAYDQSSSETRLLLKTPSLHPVVDHKRFHHLDMTVDIDNSGLSDLLIADFTAYHLLVQKADGSFSRYRLAIDAQVQLWGSEPQFMPRKPYTVDINLDGKTDIVFVRDGQLITFLQQPDGGFPEQPRIINLDMEVSLDTDAIVRSGEGRDFGGLIIHRVHDLTDLDGDGLADLIIRREKYSSAVEQDYNYRIHYGQPSERGLIFPAEPDAHINTRGIQFEAIFADINGDNRKDFYTPSATFGIGTIIRALVSGTANIEMQFYLMKEDRRFNDKPDHSHNATASVSVGRGALDLPLFQVASTTGDSRKDLIIGEGQERLVVLGKGDKRLFTASGTKFNTSLPRDGSRVKVMDINGDDREDLVLPFDAQDATETRNQVRFLILQ